MGHRYENLWKCVNRRAVVDGFVHAMIKSPGNHVLWLTAQKPTMDSLLASDPELFSRVSTLVDVFFRLAIEKEIMTPSLSGGEIGALFFHSANGAPLESEYFGRDLDEVAYQFKASMESLNRKPDYHR